MSGFLGNVQAGQTFATPVAPVPPAPVRHQADQIGVQQQTVVATDAGNANGENQAQAKSAVTQTNQLPGFAQLGLPANGAASQAATAGTLIPPAAFVAAVTTQNVKSPLVSAIGEQVPQPAPADSTTQFGGNTRDLVDQIGEQSVSTLVTPDSTTQLTTQVRKIVPDAIGENVSNSANASNSSTNAGPVLPPIRK